MNSPLATSKRIKDLFIDIEAFTAYSVFLNKLNRIGVINER